MMYSRLNFGPLLLFVLVQKAYTSYECPMLPSNCSCSRNADDEPNILDCRELDYKDLQSVMNSKFVQNFDRLKIIRSKLTDINDTLISDIPVDTLEIKLCRVETFHLFEGLNSLRSLTNLIIDHTDVTKWVFSPADEESVKLQEFSLLDCLEGHVNDFGIINHLPENITSIKIKWCGLKNGDLSFQRFSHLKSLDLSNNMLTTFNRSNLPQPAHHLQSLNLNKNPIQVLPNNMFIEMPELKSIDLQWTHLTTIQYKLIKPVIQQLEQLEFANTPLNCDCHMSWLMPELKNVQIPKCATPEDLKDRSLDSLIPKEMCQPKGANFEEIRKKYCEEILRDYS